MKKTYIQPSMKVFVVNVANVLAATSPSNVAANDALGNGTQLGKFFDDEDDWDE